jgi:GGDEF domain-containing protein
MSGAPGDQRRRFDDEPYGEPGNWLLAPQTGGFALLTGAIIAGWLLGARDPLPISWLIPGLAGITAGCGLAGLLIDGSLRDWRAWLWVLPTISALLPWSGGIGLVVIVLTAAGALWLAVQPSGRSWLGLALVGNVAGVSLTLWNPDMLAAQTGRGVAAIGVMFALAGRIFSACTEVDGARARVALLESELGVDEETGLPGLRRFNLLLASEWQRARRDGSPLSLILVEFPPIASEQQEFATAVGLAARRASDIAARLDAYGYALLLPGTGGEGARTVIAALRANLCELVGDSPIRLGYVSCCPAEEEAMRAEEMLEAAQAELVELPPERKPAMPG